MRILCKNPQFDFKKANKFSRSGLSQYFVGETLKQLENTEKEHICKGIKNLVGNTPIFYTGVQIL